MQKSKLGISVGFLGAAVCFAALIGGTYGFLATAVIGGYILLREDNEWLRKTAVKAMAILIVFLAADTVIGFIPGIIGLLDSLFGIFGGGFSLPIIPGLVSLCRDILDILQTLILVLLGLKAFSQGTVSVPVVDDIVNKHIENKVFGEERVEKTEKIEAAEKK